MWWPNGASAAVWAAAAWPAEDVLKILAAAVPLITLIVALATSITDTRIGRRTDERDTSIAERNAAVAARDAALTELRDIQRNLDSLTYSGFSHGISFLPSSLILL
ncbi:MAG TPA: hypothetical protein VES88_10105 [Gemmatimonadaceae bacterium]|nr:hypothetical protein [Gemmatimonadaceae bacterium]